jgi:hypothetical protein
MTQKNQSSLDLHHKNTDKSTQKRKYEPPKLFVDLLGETAQGKFHAYAHEASVTPCSFGTQHNILLIPNPCVAQNLGHIYRVGS